tara:strand:+ start:1004 stop:1444 length:441 start_codon:yes stop_codon:yes gene_type:complete
MQYNQKVRIQNTKFKNVSIAFHSIKLVKFLTNFQPVKIIEWSGIQNQKLAYFKLWLFGWKTFKVKHQEYKLNDNELSFIDKGVVLPLGIKSWKHKHIIKRDGNNTIIKDLVYFSHSNFYIGYLLFPILMFPIIIRILLYKIYFLKK